MIEDIKKYKTIFITDKNMTRFNITLEQSVNFVLNCILKSKEVKFLFQKYQAIEF